MNKTHHFPGFLIAIEGIDGAGKTTQAHHVQCELQSRKLKVIRTKEPTQGHWGQQLRDSGSTGRLSLEEEIDYFMRDRKEHVETVINPELKEGNIVIADRYYFSSMAYQGARNQDPLLIMRQNELFAPEPDLLIVLDIEPKIGIQRIRMRGDRANHFEKTGTLKKARDIFNDIRKPYCYFLNGEEHEDVLCRKIVNLFVAVHTNRTFHSGASPKEMINATLNLFGGDPIE